MQLWAYAVRRILQAIPVALGIMTVLFVVVSALPAPKIVCAFGPPNGRFSPCTTSIPCVPNPAINCPNPVYQSDFNALGLNQPVYVQWFIFMGNALTFHWGYVSQGSAVGLGLLESGTPTFAGQPVSGVVAEFLPYSVELLLLTFLFIFMIVVPIRNRARAHPEGPVDRAAHAITLLGYGIPLLFVGILSTFAAASVAAGASSPICGSGSTAFLDFYGSWPLPPCTPLYGTANLGPVGYPAWLLMGYHSTPTGFPTIDAALHGDGWLALDTLFRMILPALVLAFIGVAVVFRYARFAPFDKENPEYLRAARARGLPESDVTRRLAGRSTFVEAISGVGPALAVILGMLPVVEICFNLWGIGRFFAYSVVGGVNDWDIALLFGTLLTCAFIVLVVSFAMDMLRAYLDPRFREGGGKARATISPSSVLPDGPVRLARAA